MEVDIHTYLGNVHVHIVETRCYSVFSYILSVFRILFETSLSIMCYMNVIPTFNKCMCVRYNNGCEKYSVLLGLIVRIPYNTTYA